MRLTLLFVCLFTTSFLQAQVYADRNASPAARASSLLAAMTLDEKLAYIGGEEPLYIRAIPRLHLPRIVMSDGPAGVDEYGNSTAYPAGIMDAATWDTTLIQQLGKALGRDARARGVHILLAPGVNMYRAPMCGRNFEYLGEDPYLAGRMAVSYIKGVQGQGVVATVKHFAANNQEWNRHKISSDIAERTLHEIYLPAFKAAVKDAHVDAVMDSYNLVNGVHATQNGYLNKDVLKGDWQFGGILMSDWWSTYDGVAAANNGLDLEMPSGKWMHQDTLLAAINNGRLAESVIDDKVRRILQVIFKYGFYDRAQTDSTILKDDPANAAIALQVAREGAVLLKNDHQVLPLSNKTVRTLAVIGPNAHRYIAGGGSSYTTPFHASTILDGVKQVAGGQTTVIYVPALLGFNDYVQTSTFMNGLKADYYANGHLGGAPSASRVEKIVDHQWGNKPDIDHFPEGHFSGRWTGTIQPSASNDYVFSIRANGTVRLYINDQLVIDSWNKPGPPLQSVKVGLDSGGIYDIKLEYSNRTGFAGLSFAWYNSQPDFNSAIAAAKQADAAIVCAGFNEDQELEGYDRTFDLPDGQDGLISAVAKVNAKTIVVLNAGGNVNMQPWLTSVPGLLHAWYPGQEGGQAIAEILFGKVNPSGKLPASFEKEWKDNPTYDSYYDEDGDHHVLYKEGLFVGYRGYEKFSVQPQFPFGFGLSYTTFKYSHIKVKSIGTANDPKVLVTFDIKNTGNYDGAEVAQVYIHQKECAVERPYKELKGFAKVFLKKGETKRVTIELDKNAFSYYKTTLKHFDYDAGAFDILVGSSSQDIRLYGTIGVQ